ncbi:MAG TPA: OmpA family protein [Alphaproteobacteria bacterium]|nr:OmpA family protein [Alphaproteobacteria bacterium]
MPATTSSAATTAGEDEPKVTPAPRVPVESAPADASTPPPRASAPQVAARPSAGVAVDPTQLRVEFAAGSAELSDAARDALARRAETFKRDESSRIQVQAFATGGGGSEPRRLSLSRALAVRAFFVERGIAGTRIDVRALGERSDDGPAERVDILTVRR